MNETSLNCIPAAPSKTVSDVARPGISPDTIFKNRVRRVNAEVASDEVGYYGSGILIPYFDKSGSLLRENGKAYARLRLDKPPIDRKYHQPKGSSVKAYIPAGLFELCEEVALRGLTLVEGEFKALALTEAGFPAIGLSGFYGYRCAEGEKLLPQIDEAIRELNPEVIYFSGDSDTSLNCQFSDAAFSLQRLLPDISLKLPRIPLVGLGKGVDDCKESLQSGFSNWWSHILQSAAIVDSTTSVPDLACRLLEGQQELLTRFISENGDNGKEKILRFIKSIEKNSSAYTRIRKIVSDATGLLESGDKIGQIKGKRLPEMYYYEGNYFRADHHGQFMKILCRDAERELKYAGFGNKKIYNEATEIDVAVREIQMNRSVNGVGQLCGRQPGIVTENGFKYLVTRGPEIIKASEPVDTQEASPVFEFLNAVFGRGTNPEFDYQLLIFMAWLQRARRALREPDKHLEGQMLVLVGPAGCGKTYLQTLITKLLGGRSCDPSLWVQDKTPFNGDLWQNEHLCMSDANLDPSGKGKVAMRDKIKEIVANSTYPYHQKGKEQLSLRPIWRLSLSANDDVVSANVLPVLEKSTSDKIIYFKCYSSDGYFPEEEDRETHQRAIINALPAFLHLVENYELPEEHKSTRWGVTAWHHPDCVGLLENCRPEMELEEILEKCLMDSEKDNWNISVTNLYTELNDHLDGGLRRCSKNAQHLGYQLGRLMSSSPWDKVIQKEIHREGPNRCEKVYYCFNIALLKGGASDKEITEFPPELFPEV
jgi:energy-coupling factor transporter ATP-binding protein EcfA2